MQLSTSYHDDAALPFQRPSPHERFGPAAATVLLRMAGAHRSLLHRATPAAFYDTLPKALPGPSRPRHPGTTTGPGTTASSTPPPANFLRGLVIDPARDHQP